VEISLLVAHEAIASDLLIDALINFLDLSKQLRQKEANGKRTFYRSKIVRRDSANFSTSSSLAKLMFKVIQLTDMLLKA
jgi:hypothetical protein